MLLDYLLNITWVDKWDFFVAVASLLVTLFIAYKANRWAMKYWHMQKQAEINYSLENLRYQNKFEAAKATWALLSFLSEKENGNNILNYKGTKEEPKVYFNQQRGKKYLVEISKIFYEQGAGVFISKEIKELIFHVRTNVYKFIDGCERNGVTDVEVLINNPGLVQFFRESYTKLLSTTKDYLLKELNHRVEE